MDGQAKTTQSTGARAKRVRAFTRGPEGPLARSAGVDAQLVVQARHPSIPDTN
jgi:hypothetical protein